MFKGANYFLGTAVAVTLFVGAAGNLSNVRELSSDSAMHTVQIAELSRLENEMLRFRVNLAAYMRNDQPVTRDEMLLSYDILWSRIDTELSFANTHAIQSLVKHREKLEQLARDIRLIEFDVAALVPGEIERWHRIEAVIVRESDSVFAMTNEAYAELYRSAPAATIAQRKAIEGAQSLMQILVVSIIAAVLLLMWRLRRGERDYVNLAEQEAEARQQSTVDPLTQLKNRRYFDMRMCAIDDGQWKGNLHTLMIDLDGFKLINDTHGHDAGDHVLRVIADRMRKLAPDHALLARLGGDEFAMVVEDFDVSALARFIIHAVEQPIEFGDTSLQVNASIGISRLKAEQASSHVLLREADTALYAAKSAGKGCAKHFDTLSAAHITKHRKKISTATAA